MKLLQILAKHFFVSFESVFEEKLQELFAFVILYYIIYFVFIITIRSGSCFLW